MRSSIVLALLVLAMPARADDVEEAKKQFQLGTMNYDLEQYEEALESFERARKLKPLPGFLFNIAQCHRRLGHHDEAITFFEQYLKEAPAAKNAAEVKALIAEERKAAQLARSGAGTATPPQIATSAGATDGTDGAANDDAAGTPEGAVAAAPLAQETAPATAVSEGDDQAIMWAAIGGGTLLVAAGVAVILTMLPAPSPASLGRVDLRTAAR